MSHAFSIISLPICWKLLVNVWLGAFYIIIQAILCISKYVYLIFWEILVHFVLSRKGTALLASGVVEQATCTFPSQTEAGKCCYLFWVELTTLPQEEDTTAGLNLANGGVQTTWKANGGDNVLPLLLPSDPLPDSYSNICLPLK